MMRKIFFGLGILLAVGGAFLMLNGSILGPRTTGIASVIGIVGLGLIVRYSPRKAKKS